MEKHNNFFWKPTKKEIRHHYLETVDPGLHLIIGKSQSSPLKLFPNFCLVEEETMADAVVSIAVERIGDLLKEAQFLSDVRDQVVEIQDELRRMKCFLKDADEKQVKDARVRNWVREVKLLAERIEDLVEIYALKVASEKGDGAKQVFLKRFASSFSKCVALHKTGSEIARVRTKISNLTTSLQSYGITSINEGESSRANDAEQERWRRMSYPHLVEDDFVGMDDTVEKLVSLVINKDQPRHLRPVSIWGMGGLGKTTVAKQVYNDNRVQRNFEGFAWICVAQVCETRRLLQDLLKQLLPGERREEIMNMGDQELVTRLYKVQGEKKCLVVVDDIWKMEDWECLRHAFPIEKKGVAGSKLLITTRIKEVAEIGHVHELECLNEDDGWELLRKKAIPKLGEEDDADIEVDAEMEKVGRDMVKKCGGLPLAIVVLGGILKTKYTIKDWKVVDRAIVSHLNKGKGIEKRYLAVEQVLLVSYNNLPGHLKTCFLFLGEYLEDEVIWTYELYEKWIVGGVVSTNDQREGESMLEVAERYLGDLAQRSMVKVELNDAMTLKFKSCSLHDLMRDLCLAKVKEEEFSSVVTIKSRGNELVSLSPTGVSGDFNPCRLAIYYDDEGDEKSDALDLESVLGSIDWQRIRSLVLIYSTKYLEENWIVSKHVEYPLSIGNCTMLRYLELNKIKFPNGKLPRRITRLVHLRHLKFQNCILKELPTSIGNLRYLQVFDLRLSHSRYQLIIPNVFWKLRQLMNLYLPFNTRVKKDQKLRLGDLSKLECLQGIDIRHFNVKDVAKLANLRFMNLLINGSSTFEDAYWFINYVNLDTSHQINGVALSFEDCDFRSEDGRSILKILFQCSVHLTWWVYNSKLPKLNFGETNCSFQLINNLTRIMFHKSEFEEDPFQILEKLPNLQSLALLAIDFPGKEIVCTATGFSQLRILYLEHLSNLEVWTMDKGAMPNLSELVISECSNLKMLPDQLTYLTALQKLKILRMPQQFQNKVGVVNGIHGEDFDKIRHVRTIIIG